MTNPTEVDKRVVVHAKTKKLNTGENGVLWGGFNTFGTKQQYREHEPDF